jgi:hypothetical protein
MININDVQRADDSGVMRAPPECSEFHATSRKLPVAGNFPSCWQEGQVPSSDYLFRRSWLSIVTGN